MHLGHTVVMWPLLYESIEHNIRVGTYGVFILLAASLAFLFVNNRAAKHGFNPDHLIITYVSAAMGGILGAKVFTALTVDLAQTLADPMLIFSASGLTYYGSLLGGLFATLIAAKFQRFHGWKLLDLFAPATILAHSIGRLGCFFAGCCHGTRVQMSEYATSVLPTGWLKGAIWLDVAPPFLATEFQAGVGRLNGYPLYPTQLWSFGAGMVLLVILIRGLKRKRFDGQVVALMLIFEPLIRFGIELFRGDARGVAVELPLGPQVVQWLPGLAQASSTSQIGLTTSQIMGLILITSGVVIWWLRRRKPISTP